MTAITRYAPVLFRAVADPAVRAVVLAALAALALRFFRTRRSSAKLAVWTAVLYASLALPVLTVLLPPLSVYVPRKAVGAVISPAQRAWRKFASSSWAQAARQHEAPRQAGIARQAAFVLGGSVKRVPHHAASVRAASAGISFEVAAVASPEPRPRAKPSVGLLTMLRPALTTVLVGVIYLVGLVFFLGRVAVGLILSYRLRRNAVDIREPRALRWLKWHALAMGLERAPLLAESEAVTVPLTFGVLRPVILMPNDWAAWETSKLAAVIAHELSHIKRNDCLTRTLSLLYRSFFWFSPLSWWLERRLAELAEESSDAAALSAGADPAHYAEVLMSFFDIANARRRVSWQGVSMARGTRAQTRIETVLSWRTGAPAKLRTSVLALLCLCALPVVFLAASARPQLVQGPCASIWQQSFSCAELPVPPPPAAPAAPVLPESAPPEPVAPISPRAAWGAHAGPPPEASPAPEQPPMPPAAAPFATPAPPPAPAPPAALHLPVYPGATNAPEQDEGVGTVRLRNARVRNLSAVRYVSQDAPEKVLNYYEAELGSYGPVIRCDGGTDESAYVEIDDQTLSDPGRCRSSEITRGATELKVAVDGAERIVAVKARGSGSEFAIVTVCPGSSTAVVVSPAVLASVAPLASVMPAVHASVASSVRHALVLVEAQNTDDSELNVQNDDDEDWTFNNTHNGMDYAIVSGNHITMNGSSDDREEVRSLQKKIPGDFIWFIHNGDSYVIRDAGTVKTAKQLYAPMEELGHKQEALGKQQEELGQQQEALGKQQEEVRVKVPADLEARLKKVQDKLHQLAGTNASQEELADLQGELGDLQGELGDLQGRAGGQQGELGRRQGELGEKQGELGRQQGELGREQGRLARQAAHQMQDILHRALSNGQAQRAPE